MLSGLKKFSKAIAGAAGGGLVAGINVLRDGGSIQEGALVFASALITGVIVYFAPANDAPSLKDTV